LLARQRIKAGVVKVGQPTDKVGFAVASLFNLADQEKCPVTCFIKLDDPPSNVEVRFQIIVPRASIF
jgi:hypothetical protein